MLFTTYYVEDKDGRVLELFFYLADAKRFAVRNFDLDPTIVCLKGPYKFEGSHAYKMKYDGRNVKFYYVERWGVRIK